MPRMLHVKAGTKVALGDYVVGSVKVSQYFGDGSIGKTYTLGETANETNFAIATDTKELTLPTDAETEMYFVKYLRDVESGALIRNKADEFPSSVRAIMKATDELARGMQNASAVLKTQGNDIDKAIALITAGNAITQNAEKTSAGIRTIALRISGTEEAKDELQEMGEDVDDFVVKTSSKTQQIIKDYTAVASNAYQGVDVLDANGNLRDTYDILLDIARIYKEIQEEDKKAGTNRAQALVEELAGKNRSNIASSILLNPQLLEDVYKTSQNSANSAQNELNAYLDSIDGRITQFENRAQEFWTKVIDSDTVKNIISFLTNVLELGTNIIDTVGVLPTILTGIGTGLSTQGLGLTNYVTMS